MGKYSDIVAVGTNGNISLYTHHSELNRLLLPFGDPSKEMSATVSGESSAEKVILMFCAGTR